MISAAISCQRLLLGHSVRKVDIHNMKANLRNHGWLQATVTINLKSLLLIWLQVISSSDLVIGLISCSDLCGSLLLILDLRSLNSALLKSEVEELSQPSLYHNCTTTVHTQYIIYIYK